MVNGSDGRPRTDDMFDHFRGFSSRAIRAPQLLYGMHAAHGLKEARYICGGGGNETRGLP
jgi:hypothetical protein